MGREKDIRRLEDMFGVGCCDCLDIGRPRLSSHPLDSLKEKRVEMSGKPTGYVKMNLRTGEVTCHSYR